LGDYVVCPSGISLGLCSGAKLCVENQIQQVGTDNVAWRLGEWWPVHDNSALVSGNDFIGGTGLWRLAIIPMSIVPIVTFILASYEGSLFALLAITLGGLLICGVRVNRTLWSSKDTGNVAVRTPKEIDGRKAA
jgi:hypothetical protein